MIEAVMFWNEPNNKSHWDFDVDPGWSLFAEMVKTAAQEVKKVNPELTRVLGGMSPIDTHFVQNLQAKGALDEMDAIAVHGFPLDWNHWKLDEWPAKIREIQSVTHLPVWVSEVGISTFGAEEVQVFGLRRTAELLIGIAPRIHWYSLYDLPQAWGATTRHREAEGSAYYRHFYMGLLREDGSPKPAVELFPELAPAMGICQWFHFNDHRLDEAVQWFRRLGVKHVRTGLSWADGFRPGAEEWFQRQMEALEEFDVTVTFCFTPEHRGIQPHHTSAPLCQEEFAQFCAEMVNRYTPAAIRHSEPGIENNGHHGNGHNENGQHRDREVISFPWNGGNSFTNADAIDALRFILRPNLAPEPLKIALICAHPGDETIGAGSRLAALGEAVSLIYTADGSPANAAEAQQPDNSRAAGDDQRNELDAALQAAGATPADIRFLGFADQQLPAHLPELNRAVLKVMEELRPDVVMTHPYEGGHPDHNATAFAVHTAIAQLKQKHDWAPTIIEMILYQNRDGEIAPANFLPRANCPVSRVPLDAEQQNAKQNMLTCFRSQQAALKDLSIATEAFRPAPLYDFSNASHGRALQHEFSDTRMPVERAQETQNEIGEEALRPF